MDKIKVIGGNVLEGKIYISGAKNAALPLVCASLLTDKEVVLKNVPKLSDITFLNGLLEYMGLKVEKKEEEYKGIMSDTLFIKVMKLKSLLLLMILLEK